MFLPKRLLENFEDLDIEGSHCKMSDLVVKILDEIVEIAVLKSEKRCQTCKTGHRKLQKESDIRKHISSNRHTNAISFANSLNKKQAGETTESCESESDESDEVIIVEKNKKDLESKDPCGAGELPPQLPKKRTQRILKCDSCSASFGRMYHLHRHKTSHGTRPHQCVQCPAKFSRKDSLDEHYKSVHLKKKTHECSECGATFRRPSRLDKHKKLKHSKD